MDTVFTFVEPVNRGDFLCDFSKTRMCILRSHVNIVNVISNRDIKSTSNVIVSDCILSSASVCNHIVKSVSDIIASVTVL